MELFLNIFGVLWSGLEIEVSNMNNLNLKNYVSRMILSIKIKFQRQTKSFIFRFYKIFEEKNTHNSM